ncbi:iron complex outermembrane recepter protein [Geopseudomonas sagittaria]|uniref:Iron complex outermembrane recepter protein n=1 Tax=Geopseudomonas sagittaria TaxID=1135990 RepID=A0A1I5PSV6_9GAMM|nr:TonB-dependent receptor [Pseudomonas sagittaria]SFP37083.1 iron complex outermembrane recepter protein [Pseudomonas sagittaria]
MPTLRRFVLLTLLPGLLSSPAGWASDLFLDSDEPLPAVLTATRLKQSPAAVPGSVTVLDRALIEASGARDIPELMRLVPGMMVGYSGYAKGNLATVNYHGSRATEARRLQVLVDGRSVYRPGLATVDWGDIPLAIEDIERIEVFRGPNTVSYGANALMGVISITSRRPVDSQGSRLKYTRGERGVDDWYASEGFRAGSGDFRLSLSGQEDNGFHHTDWGEKYRDSRRSTRMQLSASHSLADNQALDWQLAAKEGSNQRNYDFEDEPMVENIVEPGDTDKDVTARDFAGSLRWNVDLDPSHSVQLQIYAQRWERRQSWRTCDVALAFDPDVARLFAMNPEYVEDVADYINIGEELDFRVPSPPPGSAEEEVLGFAIMNKFYDDPTTRTAVCGDVNQDIDETRYDLELQDTLSLTDNLRLLSGIGYRHDRSDSQTYFNGRVSNDIGRLFGHLEWYLTEHVVLQGGVMYESDKLSGETLTPRVALNYLITPRHGLRFVYSEAIRSPDMQENNVDWRYRLSNVTGLAGRDSAYAFAYATGPGDLDQEIMRSREIGYNGHFDFGLSIDIKVFNDEIHRMISEPLDVKEFVPSNKHWMWFRGAETEIDWQLGLRDRLRLTYAYVDFDASHKSDRRLTARYSGSGGWMHDWGRGWSSGLFYYGADLLNERRFERLDLRLAKRFSLGRTDLELAGVLQQRLDDEALTWRENLYDDRRQVYFSAQVAF